MTLAEKLRERTQAGSPIMQGRTKLSTSDIIENKLTLEAADIITNADGVYAVVTFREFPENFYFGGKVLTDMIIELYDLLNAERGKPLEIPIDDPITITPTTSRSKSGRLYTSFTIE